MANLVVRNYSIYINGKKCGAASGSDINLESGDELQIGDGAVYAISQGVSTASLTLNAIVPTAPTSTPTILDALRNKKQIQIGAALVDGKILKFDAHCKSIRYSTQMANGTLTGQYDFISGEPEAL